MSKTVIFRADSSNKIGSGHVMRCLTLANALRQKGWSCRFICRYLPGHMMDYIGMQGYEVQPLRVEEDLPEHIVLADWLVVDHYEIDRLIESRWRSKASHILVIDDLANRHHDCDILLDQNYHFTKTNRYNALVPADCLCLEGPQYTLLREEFAIADQCLRQRSGEIRRILIFFGGSDPTGETSKTLRAYESMRLDCHIDVVVGNSNPQAALIKEICSRLPKATFHCQISHMAELMNAADLAIGAGGSATWERCWLGLPSMITVVADNQAEIAAAVASTGALLCLGNHEDVTEKIIVQTMSELLANPERLREMSQKARLIMGTDRQLGTWRVVSAMEEVNG